jgi:para-aminobenzoate synthetase/4-amino-4-deoxychorismate lyase
VLLYNEKGEITESTIANVAVEMDGTLYTPPVSCGLLAGTFRAHLLQLGELIERPILVEEALRSHRVLLMNSVRGKYRVELVKAEHFEAPVAPGDDKPRAVL